MKAYTNIEQSKKLAEILPIESADMKYPYFGDGQYGTTARFGEPIEFSGGKDIPCWSLAALLEVLPKKYYPIKDHKVVLILGKPRDKWCAFYSDVTGMQNGEETLADNPIDACVEMIIKLHEENLI